MTSNLTQAIHAYDKAETRRLVESGAKIFEPGALGETPVVAAIAQMVFHTWPTDNTSAFLDIIEETHPNILIQTDAKGRNVMHQIAESRRWSMISKPEEFAKRFPILKQVAKHINRKDAKGVTPLELAARNGHTQTVNLFVELGAQINQKVVMEAAKNGHWQCVSGMLSMNPETYSADMLDIMFSANDGRSNPWKAEGGKDVRTKIIAQNYTLNR